jgi:DNA-binding transcriptional MerR regulator
MKLVPCLAADAARILGVTPATVPSLESRGQLAAMRTDLGVRVFDRADVERLAAKRRSERTSTNRSRGIAGEK